jgi:hypothetical protein
VRNVGFKKSSPRSRTCISRLAFCIPLQQESQVHEASWLAESVSNLYTTRFHSSEPYSRGLYREGDERVHGKFAFRFMGGNCHHFFIVISASVRGPQARRCISLPALNYPDPISEHFASTGQRSGIHRQRSKQWQLPYFADLHLFHYFFQRECS